MIDQEFYSVKEVAVIFAVNEKTIRRAIRRGWIPAFQIGKGKGSPYRISKVNVQKLHLMKSVFKQSGDMEILPL
jgi:excisionase family DNA binding protein